MLSVTGFVKDANGQIHDISLVQTFLSPNQVSELGIGELLLGAPGSRIKLPMWMWSTRSATRS